MRELNIRLLGDFSVNVDGAAVPRDAWERRRGADLVKLLALAPGHRLVRDRVVESLWPHLNAEAGIANLHKAATMARKALGDRDAVVVRDREVMLAPKAEVCVDTERFEAERDPAAYGGELLPADRYEEWTFEAREQLRDIYLQSLRDHCAWNELVAEEPGDEEAQREVMRALAGDGNRHGALRQFRRLADALEAEGLRPDAETRALYDEIVARLPVCAPLAGGPALLGREIELRALDVAQQRASEGHGGVVLIRGDPGIGKTRLAEEQLALAAERGWATLRGSGASEKVVGPYAAVTEALERMLAARPDLEARIPGPARAELARLCPTLGGNPSPADLRSDRGRIFSAVSELLVSAANEHGVVMFIDDIDRAGIATAELCVYLGSVATFESVLIVAAYRGSSPATDRIRSELLGRGLAVEIALGPIRREASAQLVDAVIPEAAGPEIREEIVERSGGVPFYLVELAAATRSDTALTVPAHVYEIAQAGLDRIATDARDRISLLATLSGPFTTDELIAITGCDEADAFAALDAALEAGVIEEEDGAFRFRSAMVKEASAHAIPPHRRDAARRDAARRLADSGGSALRIAEHLLAAGLESEAVPWLTRAAGEATSVAAYEDALGLVERALPHAGSERRTDLLGLRADLLLAIGDPGAPAAYAEALSEPGARSPVELRVNQARGLLLAGDVTGASAAIADLEPASVADQARLTFVGGMLAWFRGEIDTARRLAEAARPLAIDAQLPMEIEQSTQLHAAVAHSLGDWPGRLRSDLKATFRLPNLAGAFFDAHHCWAEYELASGPTSPIRDAALELCAEAENAGARRAHAFAAVVAGEAEFAAGDVEAAKRRLGDAAELARVAGADSSQALARLRLGEAAIVRGEQTRAGALLSEATELAQTSSIPHHLLYHVYAARMRAVDDRRLVMAELTEGEAVLAGSAKCAFCPLTFNTAAAGALAFAGDTEGAAAYLRRAESAVPLWPPGSFASALVAEGAARIATARGMTSEVATLLGEAAAGFEAAARPLELDRVARLQALMGS